MELVTELSCVAVMRTGSVSNQRSSHVDQATWPLPSNAKFDNSSRVSADKLGGSITTKITEKELALRRAVVTSLAGDATIQSLYESHWVHAVKLLHHLLKKFSAFYGTPRFMNAFTTTFHGTIS